MAAIGLLKNGKLDQSEIARQLKVCRRTVSRWAQEYGQGGKGAMKKAGRAGRKAALAPADVQRPRNLLKMGLGALGYETPFTGRAVQTRNPPNRYTRRTINTTVPSPTPAPPLGPQREWPK